MLKLRAMTGYEIKQAYQRGPANFMPISFGQIYPALAKLRQEKMVALKKQQGGRGNIRYFITSKGEATFREITSPRQVGKQRASALLYGDTLVLTLLQLLLLLLQQFLQFLEFDIVRIQL